MQTISRNKYCKSCKVNKISIILFIFIILSCVFCVRVIKVLKQNNERGAYAYVQVVNYELSFVKEMTYKKEEFAENNLSIKNTLILALGLDKIDSFRIISAEAASINVKNYSNSNKSSNSSKKSKEFFSLSEDSILKNNPETDSNLKKQLDQTNPEVLIYHTHTMESYSEDGPDSVNEEYSVIGVGNAIEKELESNYGIATIHDKTNHSVSYIKSYERSNQTVKRYLDKYKDFKLIIDIHRDSAKNKNSTTVNINGENVATIMYVNAKNSTRYQNNKKVSDFFQNRTEELYPGMCKGVYTYNSGINAFNQGLSDNSILMEFGSDLNSSEEAQKTGKLIARIIAEYVNTK